MNPGSGRTGKVCVECGDTRGFAAWLAERTFCRTGRISTCSSPPKRLATVGKRVRGIFPHPNWGRSSNLTRWFSLQAASDSHSWSIALVGTGELRELRGCQPSLLQSLAASVVAAAIHLHEQPLDPLQGSSVAGHLAAQSSLVHLSMSALYQLGGWVAE